MARKIELEFYDKKYTIEYNRASIRNILNDKTEDVIDKAIVLIKGGLQMHHKDEMPSDDEIFGWVMAMGEELKDFIVALQELIQDTLDTFKSDRKNLKWGKVA